jgi:tRNA threonylcarbamoyladenosine biosynthesis protein TsaE
MKVSRSALPAFAAAFVATLPKGPSKKAFVVGLEGELGAGKTAFVQEVAKALGVLTPVTSPTFVLVRTYTIRHSPFERLIHIDAYRLNVGDTDTFGFREYAEDPGNLILVEWPENLPAGIVTPHQGLNFAVTDDDTREITESA